MHHATETIATEDTSVAPLFRRRHRRTCRTWHEGQRSMRPVAVVVLREDVEDALQMLVVKNQQPVKTL